MARAAVRVRNEKQKARSGGRLQKLSRAGSTTDGKDVRRDHTLIQGGAPSAPQSFPILWRLGGTVFSVINNMNNNWLENGEIVIPETAVLIYGQKLKSTQPFFSHKDAPLLATQFGAAPLLGDYSILMFPNGIEIRGADTLGNTWIPKDQLKVILSTLISRYDK